MLRQIAVASPGRENDWIVTIVGSSTAKTFCRHDNNGKLGPAANRRSESAILSCRPRSNGRSGDGKTSWIGGWSQLTALHEGERNRRPWSLVNINLQIALTCRFSHARAGSGNLQIKVSSTLHRIEITSLLVTAPHATRGSYEFDIRETRESEAYRNF
jgi:hypothetical protein